MASSSVVSIAERLKQRREELGISQSQAARGLDVARTAYRLWEMEAAQAGTGPLALDCRAGSVCP